MGDRISSEEKIRLLVINPNTSEQMTEQIDKQLKAVCPSDVELTVVSNCGGPVSIEGHLDEIVSAYQMLSLDEITYDFDGYLIACFSNHPAISMLREITGRPVVGIAEGACHVASLIGHMFAVVTTSPKWVPMLSEAVDIFGLKDKSVGVFSSGLSVESLHDLPQQRVEEEILKAANVAIEEGAEVICLGCAGMSGMKERIENELGIPVVDACEAGFLSLYSICKMKLTTSRKCMYEEVMPRTTKELTYKVDRFYK